MAAVGIWTHYKCRRWLEIPRYGERVEVARCRYIQVRQCICSRRVCTSTGRGPSKGKNPSKAYVLCPRAGLA